MHIYILGINTTWSKWRAIFSRKVSFCKGMLPIEKEYSYSFCLANAIPFEWKCLFVKPALVNSNYFLKSSIHVWSSFAAKSFTVFSLPFFRFGGKGRKLRLFSCRGCPYRNIAFSWFCFGSKNANWGPEKNFFNPESWIEDWRLKMFFSQPSIFNPASWIEEVFFPAFNLQFSKEDFSQPSIFNFQNKFFSLPSIFNPASWIEEVFSQPSIFNFHKKFSSPPSMFNLQSSLLDWRSFFPAFNLQFSKEVFSQPSIFNPASWIEEVFSQPSIFNFQKKSFPSLQSSIQPPGLKKFFPSLQSSIFTRRFFPAFNLQSSMRLDWRSFFPAFNLQFSKDVFFPAFNLQFSKDVFSQPSIFNPASWIEEVFS